MAQNCPEPSVLDFVISRLAPWRGKRIEIPPPQENEPSIEQPFDEKIFDLSANQDASADKRSGQSIPWRTLLSMGSALVGQLFLEPPASAWPAALLFYFLAVIFLIISYRHSEWQLPALAGENPHPLQLKIHRTPALFCALFSIAALLTFSENRFSPVNLILWSAALISALLALYPADHRVELMQWIQEHKANAQKINLHITLPTGWFLLVASSIITIIFFRFFRLTEVPIEMFSDQAEKLWDVHDIFQGEYSIFFPRNTGREAFQFYLTAAIATVFGTGISFTSLKIGTVLAGLLTLPFIYLLGKELGTRRAGLLAAFLAGVAYWPNVISRIGLRFPLYPLFVAPAIYYLLHGLRTSSRRDFILAGLALGIGLHGYTPIRILPLVILVAVLLYMLHNPKTAHRTGALLGLGVVVLFSFILFLPLFRYMLDNPFMFGYRAFSRLGTVDMPVQDPVLMVFLSNLWNAMKMFFVDDGEIWVHSVPGRPALDVVSAALFGLGCLLLFFRYLRQRNWQDLFLLLSIPLLMLPSILSLAFPAENPALNRASGAIIPVFIIAALALDSLVAALTRSHPNLTRKAYSLLLCLGLLAVSSLQNFDLVFRQFDQNFTSGAWNTSEIGKVIRGFSDSLGNTENVYVIPFPHWIDTRLVGINAGIPNRDFAISDSEIAMTAADVRPKLFILRPDDERHIVMLRALFPDGYYHLYQSDRSASKNFLMFYVITKP